MRKLWRKSKGQGLYFKATVNYDVKDSRFSSNNFLGKSGVKLLPNMTVAERMALSSMTGRTPSLTSTTRRTGMASSTTTVCPRSSPGIEHFCPSRTCINNIQRFRSAREQKALDKEMGRVDKWLVMITDKDKWFPDKSSNHKKLVERVWKVSVE